MKLPQNEIQVEDITKNTKVWGFLSYLNGRKSTMKFYNLSPKRPTTTFSKKKAVENSTHSNTNDLRKAMEDIAKLTSKRSKIT